jgi:Fic-DOC domain mobile mystery protein B
MNADLFDAEDNSATILTPEERRDLIPAYITYRGELNEAEQANVLEGTGWANRRAKRLSAFDLVDEGFIKETHRRLFNHVWKWAGDYRNSDKNIGVPHLQVPIDMRLLIGNAKAWLSYQSYPRDELALRFHHQLVFIHPFPNGNGRFSRLMADLLVVKLGNAPFSWGAAADLIEGRLLYPKISNGD